MTILTINELNYNVRMHGDGIPLVMLHGFTGSIENWQPLADTLAQHYTVIMIDLLGHGKTNAPIDPNRYRMEWAACDIVRLLHTVTASPVNLLGYSMGGRLALYLTVHFPELVKSLILESASPGLADEQERAARREHDDALADRIERDGIEAFVDYWESIPLFATQQRLPADIRKCLRGQRLQNRPVGLANSLRGMGTGVQLSLWDDLATIQQPVLLMAGEMDTKFVSIARQMHDRIPHSRLKTIPESGHTIHLEQPDAFAGQLITFVHMAQFPFI